MGSETDQKVKAEKMSKTKKYSCVYGLTKDCEARRFVTELNQSGFPNYDKLKAEMKATGSINWLALLGKEVSAVKDMQNFCWMCPARQRELKK